MDGRRETVYSQPVIDRHLDFYGNGPTAQSYLNQLEPDYVWLPHALPVASQLTGWGWRPMLETEQSTVWVRPGLPIPLPPSPLPPTNCFP